VNRRILTVAGASCIYIRHTTRIDAWEGIESSRRRSRGRSATCSPAAVLAVVEALVGTRTQIIVYGEGRLRADTSPTPIGATALWRSGASQSMMTTVLAGVREECLQAGEVEEGGDGAGGASMVRGG
jgi:hypothetical protein